MLKHRSFWCLTCPLGKRRDPKQQPPEVLLRIAQALGSGIMNKEKADYLAEIRDKMGLSKEAAEKVIKGVQNQHLIGNLQVSWIQHVTASVCVGMLIVSCKLLVA